MKLITKVVVSCTQNIHLSSTNKNVIACGKDSLYCLQSFKRIATLSPLH